MNYNNETIKFEDLFKEEIKQRKTRQNPEQKKNYGYAIIVYILVMYVLATVLFLIAAEVPALNVTYTEKELVLEKIASDQGGLAFMDSPSFDLYANQYSDDVISIGIYDGFEVLVNANNTYYNGLLTYTDEINEIEVLKTHTLEDMIGYASYIKNWSEDVPINIYKGKLQETPSSLTKWTEILEGPITVGKEFTLALLNFTIYMTLFPCIAYLLKFDIDYDFKESKAIKSQFFVAVIIGYLYIILGNIFSNFFSGLLSDLFKLTPGEAINQEVIITALKSDGMFLMIISAVILGPIVEELIFRKALFGLIKSDKIALFASTFIFGLIHLVGEASIQEALVNGISYFVMGFIFGYIYIKNKRNVMVPIAVHMASNLVSVLAILFLL